VRSAETPSEVVVATSTEPGDDGLYAAAQHYGWPCFRGSHLDVLDRYYQTARQFSPDVVVRVTADCPVIDPSLIDHVVRKLHNADGELDYVSNTLEPRTFPRGLDVEAFRFETLERTWRDARDESCREHVTPWIYRNPEMFRMHGIVNSVDLSGHRWTVDTPEDLALVRSIFAYFSEQEFGWQDILRACAEHPDWQRFNAHIQQKAA
jgi:spore coat polysaccharide biosynthesis protein SpsF